MSLRGFFFGLNQVPPPPPPAAPATLSAFPTGTNNLQVGLAWAASAGATGYILEYSIDNSSWSEIQDTASTSYTHPTPTYGQVTHYYRVRAYSGNGESGNTTATCRGLLLGLVAYWKLDEASGDRSDSIGGNHLTDNNTVSSALGKLGNAADFVAGNTEFLRKTTTLDAMNFSGSFTFDMWVYPTANAFSIPVERGSAGSNGWTLEFTGTQIYLATYDPTSTALDTINRDEWTYVLADFDDAGNQIGITKNNGTPVTTSRTEPVGQPTTQFTLGRAGGQGYTGRLDEAGLWARVLSSAERAARYNSGAGLSYPFS
jgi:hypothetical protein